MSLVLPSSFRCAILSKYLTAEGSFRQPKFLSEIVLPHQSKKIVLVDNDDIISNDADIAETFNKFFVTIAESLSIRELLKNQLRLRVYRTLLLQQSISSLIILVL